MARLHAGFGWSKAESAGAAVAEALAQARAALGTVPPRVAHVAMSVEHDAAAVIAAIKDSLPGVLLHGATSSLGVLGAHGVASGSHGALGVLLLGGDATIGLHVASSSLEHGGRAAGRKAAAAIAAQATSTVLWMHASPGSEEDILLGIADELPSAQVFGGSAADNAIAGDWKVLTNDGPLAAGVSLLGFSGDVQAGGAMLAPHTPTSHRGVVTDSDDRLLKTVDGRPAAQVLREWIGESIADEVQDGGNILAQTSLRPLAFPRPSATGIHYVTVHPARIHAPGGQVDLFARAAKGSDVCLMQGTAEQLVDALDKLIDEALAATSLSADKVGAAMLIYCAGCAGAVGPLLQDGLVRHIGARLPGVPLIGLCTFGEQGHVPGIGNLHQDLSLSLSLIGG